MKTAPDPPASSGGETPSLRRLSSSLSRDTPPRKKGGKMLDPTPTESQIVESSSSKLKSSISLKPENGGAVVLYEPLDSPDENLRGSGQIKVPRSKTKPPPVDYESEDMRKGFDHCFVSVPCKERLSVLFATLRRSSERKVVVICSTWESAAFHAVLFRQLEMLHVYEMHENMTKNRDVADVYEEFVYQYPGILFASEIAMREFETPPNVDYFVQYEPPMDPTEYIYRMSTARIYRTSCHKALLFLTPDEMTFLEYFDQIENKELEGRKVKEFQDSVEKLVSKHSELNDLAWKAFRAFVFAYETHSYNNIYDYSKIDEGRIRRSFGQPHIPGCSSKYDLYNGGAIVAEKRGLSKQKRDYKENANQEPKPHQWMEKEKTWRSKGKTWAKKEEKTWKHTHVNL
mmetsp:Transcript_31955/g.67651  ORF Transcript_31955/g.67651 Transcript_31955/m.67651 type:complete len:401 (-) Transcript_31955:84-1286(-)|eukprot:CAMPEP_0183712560 /NCGR_PEP_ID=MMETSP0737-20130205/7657_1 /TAXON_ID=385413 /ORGANISM="Thalassiosira miniscula, Strain CCMP1093" /LENGTH=400 /DNA_ID=CAMNT_0025941195 /DNA_START=84 /DNA_END=1286 /DNA_ORIENTATION=-